jgi:hypothetical protein
MRYMDEKEEIKVGDNMDRRFAYKKDERTDRRVDAHTDIQSYGQTGR